MSAHLRHVPDHLDQAERKYNNESGENDQRCQEMHVLARSAGVDSFSLACLPGSNQLRVQCNLRPEHPGNRTILLGILCQPSEGILIQIGHARA